MLGLLWAAGAGQTAPGQALPDAPDKATLERGAYLAKIGGCAACHTDPKGGKPFAGGRPVSSPFGAIYSSNITPHVEQGIGRYTLDDFERAMRKGTARGGKHLYPAMPYASYAKMADDDISALYIYLQQGVVAVDAPTPQNKLPFPFNQRWTLRWWKALFLQSGSYQPRANQSAEWNRGAYLVQSIGHCGACHTPRGVAYQERGYDERSPKFLTGQVNDHWYSADLTNNPASGVGRMQAADLAALIRTGHGGGSVAFGSMAEEIEETLQHISEVDARAVAVYLKALPGQDGSAVYQPGEAAKAPTKASKAEGNYTASIESTGTAVYKSFCARCHQLDGKGAPPQIPALAGNPSVLARDTTSLSRLVIEGGRGPKTAHGPEPMVMPQFAGTLTDVQMAQVLSYVRQSWGNQARSVSTNDLSQVRKNIER
jgi:mono/diheme cytochrome c family protein